nr:hypothetical protein [Lachnospiraceae bacterium]
IMAAGMMLTGCGSTSKAESITRPTITSESEVSAGEAAVWGKTAKSLKAPYFARGVYVYYAKDVEDPSKEEFYVFESENSGHTDNGVTGVGTPFDIIQNDGGTVEFHFGGADEEEDVFTVTSCKNGTVTGLFEDGNEVIFEPVFATDPGKFSAEEYLEGSRTSGNQTFRSDY